MNNTIRLIDEHFESQHSGKCDLLIQINAAYISYAIIDKGQDQLRVLCQTALNGKDAQLSALENIDNLLQTEPHLKYHFRKIKISLETFKFTFIPSELYTDSSLADYAKFIQPVNEADILLTDIKAAQSKNIIAVPAELQHKLRSCFHEVHLFSQADSFIEGAKNIHNTSSLASQLFLNINETTFEAVLLQDAKFVFYNIFDYQNADEFNYFLLTIMQQLAIDRHKTRVTLAGDIIESDEIYKRIEKYFKDITFADSKLLARQSGLFKTIPSHLFFSLMSLGLCE